MSMNSTGHNLLKNLPKNPQKNNYSERSIEYGFEVESLSIPLMYNELERRRGEENCELIE